MTLTKNTLIALATICILQASALKIKVSTVTSTDNSSLDSVYATIGGCHYEPASSSALPVTLHKGNTTSCDKSYPVTFDLINDSTTPSLNVTNTTVPCKLQKTVAKKGTTTKSFRCAYLLPSNETTSSTTTTAGVATTATVTSSVTATADATTTTVSKVLPTATTSVPSNSTSTTATASETATTTGSATGSTTAEPTSTTTPTADCQKVADVFGAGNFSGQPGDCCLKNKDCLGKCINGVCQQKHTDHPHHNKPQGPHQHKPADHPHQNKHQGRRQRPAQGPPKCHSHRYFGKGNGMGPQGVCCRSAEDCSGTCVEGSCRKA